MSLHIPNTAPFTGAQKMWLKGYLDAINSAIHSPSNETPILTASAPSGRALTILWGSQTGTSESLGKKLSKTLAAKGHTPTLRDMAEISPADLSGIEHLLIITSTYGEGEAPENAAALHAALHAADAPALPLLNFAVLALGDSSYAEFCKCGRDFHDRLSALGAKPLLPLVESDVDFDTPFANWISQLDQVLAVA